MNTVPSLSIQVKFKGRGAGPSNSLMRVIELYRLRQASPDLTREEKRALDEYGKAVIHGDIWGQKARGYFDDLVSVSQALFAAGQATTSPLKAAGQVVASIADHACSRELGVGVRQALKNKLEDSVTSSVAWWTGDVKAARANLSARQQEQLLAIESERPSGLIAQIRQVFITKQALAKQYPEIYNAERGVYACQRPMTELTDGYGSMA